MTERAIEMIPVLNWVIGFAVVGVVGADKITLAIVVPEGAAVVPAAALQRNARGESLALV